MNESKQRGHAIELQIARSQKHVDLALQQAEAAVERWRSASARTPSHYQSARDSVQTLQAAMEHHFDRVSGEGLLEDAVNQSPELYSRLRQIENWQQSLLNSARDIGTMTLRVDADEKVSEIRTRLAKLRAALLSEEFEEQHIVAEGFHKPEQESQ